MRSRSMKHTSQYKRNVNKSDKQKITEAAGSEIQVCKFVFTFADLQKLALAFYLLSK
jgi:hypothetical protein